jgi:hypothetical protein
VRYELDMYILSKRNSKRSCGLVVFPVRYELNMYIVSKKNSKRACGLVGKCNVTVYCIDVDG